MTLKDGLKSSIGKRSLFGFPFFLYPSVFLLPFVNPVAGRTAHAEFKIQAMELDNICGQAGRNGHMVRRATDHDPAHQAPSHRDPGNDDYLDAIFWR
jgi:hypothetical protein